VCARRVNSTFTSNDDPVPMPGPTTVLVPGYRNQCLRLTSHNNKERGIIPRTFFSHQTHPQTAKCCTVCASLRTAFQSIHSGCLLIDARHLHTQRNGRFLSNRSVLVRYSFFQRKLSDDSRRSLWHLFELSLFYLDRLRV
jgi:hypothetical protein